MATQQPLQRRSPLAEVNAPPARVSAARGAAHQGGRGRRRSVEIADARRLAGASIVIGCQLGTEPANEEFDRTVIENAETAKWHAEMAAEEARYSIASFLSHHFPRGIPPAEQIGSDPNIRMSAEEAQAGLSELLANGCPCTALSDPGPADLPGYEAWPF